VVTSGFGPTANGTASGFASEAASETTSGVNPTHISIATHSVWGAFLGAVLGRVGRLAARRPGGSTRGLRRARSGR